LPRQLPPHRAALMTGMTVRRPEAPAARSSGKPLAAALCQALGSRTHARCPAGSDTQSGTLHALSQVAVRRRQAPRDLCDSPASNLSGKRQRRGLTREHLHALVGRKRPGMRGRKAVPCKSGCLRCKGGGARNGAQRRCDRCPSHFFLKCLSVSSA
jgi:hypothetical protein